MNIAEAEKRIQTAIVEAEAAVTFAKLYRNEHTYTVVLKWLLDNLE